MFERTKNFLHSLPVIGGGIGPYGRGNYTHRDADRHQGARRSHRSDVGDDDHDRNDDNFTGAADTTIQGLRVTDYRIVSVGTLQGESTPRPIEYELYLSDARADLVAPFGGRVNEGLVNPDANDDDRPDVTPIPVSQLIAICCKAMGFTPALLPPQADNVAPPLNLRWFGVPAEAELAKLLEASGSLMAPNLGGGIGFYTAGVGGSPNASGPLLDSDVTDPAPVGRGDTVIFSSAPSGVIDTLKATGADLEFVMPDVDGVWRSIDDPTITLNYWHGSTAVAQVQQSFKGVAKEKKDTPKRYAFRCIRLNPTKYDPSLQRMLRRVVNAVDGSTKVKLKGLTVRAKRAVKQDDGWVNPTELVKCNAEYLLGPNVIIVSELLGKLSTSPAQDLAKNFARLSGGEIEVEFSIEGVVTSSNGTGRKVPEYSYFAYRRNAGGGFDTLAPEASASLAASPEPGSIFVNVASLRRVRDATGTGAADNLQSLQQAAGKLAAQYFAGAAQQTRTIVLAGYHAVELNGRVHEVRYNQQSLTTTIVVDKLDSAAKTRFLSNLARAQLGGGAGAAGHGSADPLPLGSVAGGVQPAVPLGPAGQLLDDVPLQFIPMRISGNPSLVAGKQRYSYPVTEQQKATAGSSGTTWEDKPGGRNGTAFNFVESNNDSSGLLGNGVTVTSTGEIKDTKIKFQPAPLKTFVMCVAVPVISDNTIEYWFSYENGMDGSCS